MKNRILHNRSIHAIFGDGIDLLNQIYADSAPTHLRTIPAVEILRLVWLQQFYLEEGQPRWRGHKNIAPAAKMIASPYDVQARLSEKRGKAWQGYKFHFDRNMRPDGTAFDYPCRNYPSHAARQHHPACHS